MQDLVLASTSPRRKELLQKLNIPFITFAPNVNESISLDRSPQDIVMTLSLRKANAALNTYPDSIIIGSDTIVVSGGKVLGKPDNEEDAKQMLKQLSGQVHSVYTGVTIIDSTECISFFEKTDVEFWTLEDVEIEQYVESGEPLDKAGAYGIQGLGALLVKSIQGDYYSVVGLPISRLARSLRRKGFFFQSKR
ncbi:Maf family protein [Bacillus niameyensis]|uniref:Maf family protein n=1 Tax=Bacillus niameyensis TaxID=1522308 RepID=UPI000781BDA0|nr:Maf family protein [Bacillus niameyensis]